MAAYGENLYVVQVHTDDSLPHNNFWCRVRDAAGCWSGQGILTGAKPHCSSAPALTATPEGLLLIWRQEDGALYSSLFDGTSWSGQQPVSSASGANFQSSTVPALVSFGKKALLVGTDKTKNFWYSVRQGTTWSPKRPALDSLGGTPPLALTEKPPALVFLEDDDKVVMTWMYSDGSLCTTQYLTESDSWQQTASPVLGPGSTYDGPAMTLFYGRPLMVWKDVNAHSYRMWCRFYDGYTWAPTYPVPKVQIDSQTEPAATYLGDKVYLLWVCNDTGELAYCSAPTIGATDEFGQDPGSIVFSVCHNDMAHRTFIQQDGNTYLRGRFNRPANSQKPVTISISNGSAADHSIQKITALFNDTPLVISVITVASAPPQWRVTLPAELICPSGGTLHINVTWLEHMSGRPFENPDDPVIIVNVGN